MSLMMMRAALISRNALPPQYQRVEYLQNSNGTYILIDLNRQINIKSITNLRFIFAKPTTYGAFSMAFGCRDRSDLTHKEFYVGGEGDVKVIYSTVDEVYYSTTSNMRKNTFFQTQYESEPTVNGVGMVSQSSRAGYDFFTNKIAVFGIYDVADRIVEPFRTAFKIYACSCNLFNLIPCRRKSDNKPGMWDTVSKTFFTNAGTGEDFTLGPDVL